MPFPKACLLVLLLFALPVHAQDVPSTPRVYTAHRLQGAAPAIDGRLDDPCWQSDGWTGGFTQQIPRFGKAPSQRTAFQIRYDDRNLYVAIRAHDTEPQRIDRQMGRRDEFAGDGAGVAFDSYHDKRTAYEFNLTAAGVKVDVMHRGNNELDFAWDAVWNGATALEDSAWTAEMRIPLSQLRFSNEDEQVWGLHVWRWIHRLEEEDQFQPLPTTVPAVVPYFGELRGIAGLHRVRRVELMPYMTGSLRTAEPESGNPFATGRSGNTSLGMDGKLGLSSAFTLDLTINPDFGQVEADPSVMNLTAFETFFQEKRPFFLEGSNILSFAFGDDQMFYSRRVGASPHRSLDLSEGEYARVPESTSILGAAKLTGKTQRGLSVGVLESLTSREQATVAAREGWRHEPVQPLANYLVGRVEQDLREGNTVVGGMATAVNRRLDDPRIDDLPAAAYSAGADLRHRWGGNTYFLNAKLVGSALYGGEAALTSLQESAVHNFQRPDARHLRLDSTRTSLLGYGGSLDLGKNGGGRWRYSTNVRWRSPGLDLNDAGFLQQADLITQGATLAYIVNDPGRAFRSYAVRTGLNTRWNFAGWHLATSGWLQASGQLASYWRGYFYAERGQSNINTRLLRGGPAMLMPGYVFLNAGLFSDQRQRFSYGLELGRSHADVAATHSYAINPSVSWRPLQSISVGAELSYQFRQDDLQYIDVQSAGGREYYVLGRIEQETASLTLRANLSLRPNLSVQFYGQPFVSAGDYRDLKLASEAPRAAPYAGRFRALASAAAPYDAAADAYRIDADGDQAPDFTLDNPDFTFRELRSNLVLRWEYHPGSTLYVVWSQARSGESPDGRFAPSDDIQRLYELYPSNVFAIKLSYWFSAS